MTDFIIYQEITLTWFAFNLVCCFIPLIVVSQVLSFRKAEETDQSDKLSTS